MTIKRYVTTDRKTPADPKDETGKRLSSVARLRRLETKHRELERTSSDLFQEVRSLREQLGQLQDVLIDFCSTYGDRHRTRTNGTTRLIKRISALTDSHQHETRTFLPNDAPVGG
jgi:DNA anti-recombination protein RmuC